VARRANPRLVKIHRTYTVDEAARLLGHHKNTIRSWIKQGLPTIDQQRPLLIHGQDLRGFLEAKRKALKQTCRPGEIYCVGCRAPKSPAGRMADYVPSSATSGYLRGICPDCGSLIHRRVSSAKLELVAADLEVTDQRAPSRIGGSADPSVNSDFNRSERTNEIAQCSK
jgi:excisionase family DNA binding protein